jgi:hypothetical protein
MYKRIWTPVETHDRTPVTNITMYDGGGYWGELIDTEWKCWEVISRHRDERLQIVEMLIPMNADWVPFDIFHINTYPVYEKFDRGFVIDGWKIEYSPILSSKPRQEEAPPLLAQQRVSLSNKASVPSNAIPGNKERTMKQPDSKASAGQKRPGQNLRQYQEQPVKHPEQIWTPLVHIVHQETPRVKQLLPPLTQTLSSVTHSFHGHRLPSQQHPQQSSAHRLNPSVHRHNIPKQGVLHRQ